MDTPPGTTLSTPSPTEFQDKDPIAAEAEKSEMRLSAAQKLRPIYLVVATTPCKTRLESGELVQKLGIGLNGKLPWPTVKADMKYFKDVTESATDSGERESKITPSPNTVIMGRKTYFSIPQKFRPLASRHNVVITRSSQSDIAKQIVSDLELSSRQAKEWLTNKYGDDLEAEGEKLERTDEDSLSKRNWLLSQAKFTSRNSEDGCVRIRTDNNAKPNITIAKSPNAAITYTQQESKGQIFCIGGAEIYNAFLSNSELRPRLRVLQTEIEKTNSEEGFECNTFWSENMQEASSGWEEVSKQDVVDWTGIEVPQAEQDWLPDEKVGVRIRVRGWKQKDS